MNEREADGKVKMQRAEIAKTDESCGQPSKAMTVLKRGEEDIVGIMG